MNMGWHDSMNTYPSSNKGLYVLNAIVETLSVSKCIHLEWFEVVYWRYVDAIYNLYWKAALKMKEVVIYIFLYPTYLAWWKIYEYKIW